MKLINISVVLMILGILVISGCGPKYYCGDGSCNNGETCNSCMGDCGECPYEYKDEKLSTAETHSMNDGRQACEDEMYRQGYAKSECFVRSSLSKCFGTPICDTSEIDCSCKY